MEARGELEPAQAAKCWQKGGFKPTIKRKSPLWAMAAGLTPAMSIPQPMPLRFPQESVILAFRSLYPASVLYGFQFPMLEDLLNQHPFTTYPEWRMDNDKDMIGAFGPAWSSNQATQAARYG